MEPFFRSFYSAGFEGSTGINRHGEWFDQVEATGHDRMAGADFARIRRAGLIGARESVRWPLVDRGGRHDFSSLDPVLEAARREGIELLLDLFHYGYPADTDPFADSFVDRFAGYCRATARRVVAATPGPWSFAPVNEPSYYAWAAGDRGLFAPHARGRGPELKRRLAAAAIAGCEAIWSVCPGARIVSIDPLCRVVPPHDRPDLADAARCFNTGAVFECWDMLAGRLEPQLGGSPRHLGIVGVNYYWTNQWELEGAINPLPGDDARCAPLHELLLDVWHRYRAPVMLTETAAPAERRAAWLHELDRECEQAIARGARLLGACLYPILSMPEWQDRGQWTHMGLWDIDPVTLARVPHRPALDALARLERTHGTPFPHRARRERQPAAGQVRRRG